MTNVKTQALLTGVALGPIAGSDPSTAGPSPQGKVWLGYCTFAARLHHRKELTKFLDELRAGRCSDVEDRELFELAAALVVAAAEAGLRVPDWGSPPSAEELGSPTGSPAGLSPACRRRPPGAASVGDKASHARSASRASGTGGTINPVYLRSRAPLGVGAAAAASPGTSRIQREWLDHRSPNYVPVGRRHQQQTCHDHGVANHLPAGTAIVRRHLGHRHQLAARAAREAAAARGRCVTSSMKRRGFTPRVVFIFRTNNSD